MLNFSERNYCFAFNGYNILLSEIMESNEFPTVKAGFSKIWKVKAQSILSLQIKTVCTLNITVI